MKEVIFLFVFLYLGSPLFSQTQKRLALLIGNTDYVDAPLKNPENDARELGILLEKLDFEPVIVRYNKDMPRLEREIDDFCTRIKQVSSSGQQPVVCFYFSGHGMQINGTNYLVPVRHGIADQADVKYKAYPVDRLLEKLENAGGAVNIVILDACRNNPFKGLKRGGLFPELGEGLAEVGTPTVGTLIAYATSPGKTADDGREGNSPYARALLKHLPTPGITIEEVFRFVRNDVYQATRQTQIPWESSSLMGAGLYLKQGPAPLREENKRNTDERNDPVVSRNQDMIRIEGGTFQMGDSFGEGHSDEKQVHSVTLSTFYLSQYELSFSEYDAFCDATGRGKPDDRGWGRGRRPVINVSWFDAVEYCNWRSEREGRTPCYTISGTSVSCNWNANGYRLPTEAEWEYAARQRGQKVRFGNGKDIADPEEINFKGSENYNRSYSRAGVYRSKTVPVGSLNSPSSLGLHDMSGNVWEWCWDWYGSYHSSSQANPKGPDTGSFRVNRGGSWYEDPLFVRAAYRSHASPDYSNSRVSIGFRLCMIAR